MSPPASVSSVAFSSFTIEVTRPTACVAWGS